jgi:hypothetical protein
MECDWSKLTYYPHHSDGHPARYAMRQACSARRNGMESLFARLKVGTHLGTDGADRTRVPSIDTHTALVSLTMLSFTAMALAQERSDAGSGRVPSSTGLRGFALWELPIAA